MRKIMMVEDNEDHAFLVQKSVEDSDCIVVRYSDGLQALKACQDIQNQEGKPELILLDLQLPGMDGFEVLKNLRQIKGFEQIPVVFLTTSARAQEIEKAYQLGASGYVVKPEQFGDLVSKMKCVKDYWFHTVETPHVQAASRMEKK
ncbi:MAG: response regulator [Candidatus Omnitrophica bacterium]|nr:response regulator [Candidatus Omnitrophota bacterium]